MDPTLLHHEYGGIHMGRSWWLGLQAGWPLVRLDVFQDRLVFTVVWLWKTSVLKSEIQAIEYWGLRILPWMTGGVKIIHSNPNISPYIIYWPWNPRRLMEKLKEIGYPVQL